MLIVKLDEMNNFFLSCYPQGIHFTMDPRKFSSNQIKLHIDPILNLKWHKHRHHFLTDSILFWNKLSLKSVRSIKYYNSRTIDRMLLESLSKLQLWWKSFGADRLQLELSIRKEHQGGQHHKTGLLQCGSKQKTKTTKIS